MSRLCKTIIISSVIGLVLISFSLVRAEDQTQKFEAPGTFDRLKEIGRKFLELFPRAFKKAFEFAVRIWKRMWDWFKNNVWPRIKSWLRKEVRPKIEEEKKEIEKEVTETKKSLWQRLRELVR
jgi:hypothetical protein